MNKDRLTIKIIEDDVDADEAKKPLI